ncbi:PKD domain-containing protein [Cnuella takakiae]|uniref:PKD domain-containing protein n=1 Tax=Cnuella takakiae TaxID=1302690 RepID=UPI0013016A20|nr:PKD domain-containing protein [Cnuella takakiae]
MNRVAWRCFLTILLVHAAPALFAQLVADFTIDRKEGCAPLSVLFTNKTTGATAAARYQWNLGNGNTSTLFSPGATYRTEQAFIVTLTVTDGASTATKSDTIRVFRKPAVTFNANTRAGCFPLAVQFGSNVQAGDGTITGYTWDFGDGTVTQGLSEAAPAHTYNFVQKAAVSLTVTNSMGCFTTLEQPAMIDVQPGVQARFSADKKYLCQPGEAVQFTNASTGTGTLSYRWDFGDGNTATTESPRHVYNSRGRFTVKLQVTGSQGCVQEMVMPGLVNVGDFSVGIQLPGEACIQSPVPMKALLSPAADSVRWNFHNGMASALTDSVAPVFSTAGTKNIGLTAYWGGCAATSSANLRVQAPPALRGFVQAPVASCQLPYTVQLQDTAGGVAARDWQLAGQPAQDGPAATYTFTEYGTYPVNLTVRNAAGCASTVVQNIAVIRPEVKITIAATSSRYGTADCEGLKIRFATQSAVALTHYRWDFGDGSPAVTGSSPQHTFSKAGRYAVVLTFTTATGCTDSAMYQYVSVYAKPNIDFSGPATVCSSNPVGFTATSDTTVRQYYWNYGDGAGWDTITTIHAYNEHKYTREGTYTVTLVANGGGACADTVVKTNIITVFPPFQAIQNVFHDCLVDRNRVFLQLNTRSVVSGTWDFGDSTTQTAVPVALNLVPHSFATPGIYRVKHTSVNGNCTAVDSIYVPIPGKQTPVLSGSKPFVCLEDTVTLTISGVHLLDTNFIASSSQYHLSQLTYGDGSPFTGVIRVLDSNWVSGYKVVLSGARINSSGIRAFIKSAITGCVDSSNIFAVRFSGPTARIGAITPVCFNNAVQLRDSSAGALVNWQWQVGGEWLPQQSLGGDTLVRLPAPGNYALNLKVIDADGCYHFAQLEGGLNALGVKAGFQLPDTVVAINTEAQFTNTSQVAPGAAVSYSWTYDAGRRHATVTDLVYRYPNIGWDTLRLVARTVEGACADSAFGIIHHDNINAKFTFTATYINNNSCPPMLVKFRNISRNSRRTLWSFGDGSISENQNTPERTYRMGGVYKVTLYTFGANNVVDSTTEYITVKGPSANILADKQFGCLRQQVSFNASVVSANDYFWDFGDGSILKSHDTVTRHYYQQAGIYQPALVLSDSTGCSVAAELAQPIIIDTLAVAIGGIPAQICDAAQVQFQQRVTSIAADRLGQPLVYNWLFPDSSSTLSAPAYTFAGAGSYPVSVTVRSPFGCVQTATDTVVVRRTVKGAIAGRAEVCAQNDIRFTASIPDAAANWKWLLHDGRSGTALQSPVLHLKDSGFYPVQLVVTHDGCVDTARQTLWVHPNPVIGFRNGDEHVCKGLATTLQATGGYSYQWRSAEPILLGAALDKPVVYPAQTAWYQVTATSFFGCQKTDSMQVRVTQPFKLKPIADTFTCRGTSVQLMASGAATYLWSGPVGTLGETTGAQVLATPKSLSRYRVIGTDSMQCFKDTAYATVRIQELPLVQLAPNQLVLTGTELHLSARTSPDVNIYQWQPATEVQCSTCPETLAEPRKPTSYSLKVTSTWGCVAYDTMFVDLKCTDSRVFIPNAFTPDRNGLNETFSVRGKGAWVRKMVIYDRWGKLVYEGRNLQLNDSYAGWNGSCGGQQCPSGTYAYVVELVCDTGEPFVKKGTVTVIR